MRNVSRPLNTIIKAYKMFHQEISFPSSVVERENSRLSPFIPLKKNGGKLVTCTLDTSISTRNKRLGEKEHWHRTWYKSLPVVSFSFEIQRKKGRQSNFFPWRSSFFGAKNASICPKTTLNYTAHVSQVNNCASGRPWILEAMPLFAFTFVLIYI